MKSLNKLELEGKEQINKALNNIGMEDKFLDDIDDSTMLKINIKNHTIVEEPKNKCSECNNCYHDINGNGLCLIDPKRVNAYGCYDELLSNNAEPEINYPEDDPFDEYHSSMQCHLNQIGEKKL